MMEKYYKIMSWNHVHNSVQCCFCSLCSFILYMDDTYFLVLIKASALLYITSCYFVSNNSSFLWSRLFYCYHGNNVNQKNFICPDVTVLMYFFTYVFSSRLYCGTRITYPSSSCLAFNFLFLVRFFAGSGGDSLKLYYGQNNQHQYIHFSICRCICSFTP